MEIINVPVADLLGNLVHFYGFFQQQLLGVFDAYMVEVGIEVLAHLFAENLAEVRTVVAKERSNALKRDAPGIIVVYVIQNIVNDALA